MTIPSFAAAESPATDRHFFETQIDPTAESNFLLALFRLWLPDPEVPVRGVLAVLPGSDAHGTPMADDPAWQAVAARWNYALLAITYTTRSGSGPYYQAEKGSGQAMLDALRQIAEQSRHPELTNIPIALLGHSQGGQFACHFACWQPERTAAFAAIKGGYYDVKPSAAARAVPGLLLTGENDLAFRRQNIRQLFEENRSAGSRWCLANEPGAAHELGRCFDLLIPFFDAVITRKLDPVSGDPETLSLTSLATQPESTGAWLPNSEVAETWVRFSQDTLPESHLSLAIPVHPPPRLATVSPGSHDFGKIDTAAPVAPALFDIAPLAHGPAWDTLRAYSLDSRCRVETSKSAHGWQVSVRPSPDRLPLGRISETVALRFYEHGHPVLGGANLSLTFVHTSEALHLSSFHFYLGVHSGQRQMSLTLTAADGQPLEVAQATLLAGAAASISFVREAHSSGRLTADFHPLPEDGSHSGIFSVRLIRPVDAELLIPFIGAYKSEAATRDETAPTATAP